MGLCKLRIQVPDPCQLAHTPHPREFVCVAKVRRLAKFMWCWWQWWEITCGERDDWGEGSGEWGVGEINGVVWRVQEETGVFIY